VRVTSAKPGLSAPNATGALPVRFSFVAPSAARVSLVGDFNRWDPIALPLRRGGDGRTWEVEVRLPPGRYSYSFVVDGRLARDPAAPQDAADDYGSANSVLLLRGS
jgi:serine protease AprX